MRLTMELYFPPMADAPDVAPPPPLAPAPPPRPSAQIAWVALLLAFPAVGCGWMCHFGPLLSAALGITALVLERQAPARHRAGGVAVAALVISVLGQIYLLAMGPYLSSTGELRYAINDRGVAAAAAVGALRTLCSMEEWYRQDKGGGYYDVPTVVMPEWPGSGPSHAYVLTFHPGPALEAAEIAAKGLSPTSLKDYAATAVPRTKGERGFCIDAEGILYVAENGNVPTPVGGRCDSRLARLP
jgi:hypothetical protein